MPFQVIGDPGTERLREELAPVVEAALGPQGGAADWVLQVRKRDGGYLVDLANRDGSMRQWLFDVDDPIASLIRRDLTAAPAFRG